MAGELRGAEPAITSAHLAGWPFRHGSSIPKLSSNWNEQTGICRCLYPGNGGPDCRGRFRVFKRPVLATAFIQCCHCLGVCGFLPDIHEAGMMCKKSNCTSAHVRHWCRLIRSHGEWIAIGTLAELRSSKTPTLETTMQIATQSEAPTAIRTDLGAIFVSLELSRSTWLITSLSLAAARKNVKALGARRRYCRASGTFCSTSGESASTDGKNL